MQSPIADRTKTCLRSFEALDGLLAKPQPESLSVSRNADIVDSASRFRLWASNLGAYHPLADQRSADHRLRDASTIRKHLIDILDELGETLSDIEAVLSGQRSDQSVLANDADDDTGEEGEETASELQELCESLPDLMTSLFKVSILIRKNTSRDRYAKAAAAAYDQFLLDFDVRHVGDKFPKTRDQPWLQNRLGHAITKRRQYLRYQRDHGEKIAHVHTMLPVPEAQPGRAHARTAALSRPSEGRESSHPTFAPTKASTLEEQQAAMAAASLIDDDFADDRTAATSFVSSKASDDAQSGKLRVMDLQEVQKNGVEFECPYCWAIVRVRRRRAWKKHVFRDLRAYVCTFPDCSAGLFEDRQSWFQHELECHRRQWICVICADKQFSSPSDLKRHLRAHHQQESNTNQNLDAVLKASARPVREIAASSCPLCDEWSVEMVAEAHAKGIEVQSADQLMMPLDQFRRHLAEHHEQLALFAKTPSWAREVDSEDKSQRSGSSGLRVRLALDHTNEDPEATDSDRGEIDDPTEPADSSPLQSLKETGDIWTARQRMEREQEDAERESGAAGIPNLSKDSTGPSQPVDTGFIRYPKSKFVVGSVFEIGHEDFANISQEHGSSSGMESHAQEDSAFPQFLVLLNSDDAFTALRIAPPNGYTLGHQFSQTEVSTRIYNKPVPKSDDGARTRSGHYPAVPSAVQFWSSGAGGLVEDGSEIDYWASEQLPCELPVRFIGQIDVSQRLELQEAYANLLLKGPRYWCEDCSFAAYTLQEMKEHGEKEHATGGFFNDGLLDSKAPLIAYGSEMELFAKAGWQLLGGEHDSSSDHPVAAAAPTKCIIRARAAEPGGAAVEKPINALYDSQASRNYVSARFLRLYDLQDGVHDWETPSGEKAQRISLSIIMTEPKELQRKMLLNTAFTCASSAITSDDIQLMWQAKLSYRSACKFLEQAGAADPAPRERARIQAIHAALRRRVDKLNRKHGEVPTEVPLSVALWSLLEFDVVENLDADVVFGNEWVLRGTLEQFDTLKIPSDYDEQRMERLIDESEVTAAREEEEREWTYQEVKRKEREAETARDAEEVAKADEELKRLEREAEEREEQRETARQTEESEKLPAGIVFDRAQTEDHEPTGRPGSISKDDTEDEGDISDESEAEPILEALAHEYKPGDFCWVRLKGFPRWPAVVCNEDMVQMQPEEERALRPTGAGLPDGTLHDDYKKGGEKAADRTIPIIFLQSNKFTWMRIIGLTPLDPKDCEVPTNAKMNTARKEAYAIAAQNHSLDYFKDILRNRPKEQEELQDESPQHEQESPSFSSAGAAVHDEESKPSWLYSALVHLDSESDREFPASIAMAEYLKRNYLRPELFRQNGIEPETYPTFQALPTVQRLLETPKDGDWVDPRDSLGTVELPFSLRSNEPFKTAEFDVVERLPADLVLGSDWMLNETWTLFHLLPRPREPGSFASLQSSSTSPPVMETGELKTSTSRARPPMQFSPGDTVRATVLVQGQTRRRKCRIHGSRYSEADQTWAYQLMDSDSQLCEDGKWFPQDELSYAEEAD